MEVSIGEQAYKVKAIHGDVFTLWLPEEQIHTMPGSHIVIDVLIVHRDLLTS